MNPTRYGDMARWTVGAQNTSHIKTQMRILTQELASGEKSDLPKHLGFEQLRVNEIDERLQRLEAFSAVRANSKLHLESQQSALDTIDTARVNLGKSGLSLGLQPTSLDVSIATENGAEIFTDMTRALNRTVAGQAIFSGSETGRAALPNGHDILTALETAIDFTQSPDTILSEIHSYFMDDTGPYASVHYSGGSDIGMQREVAPGVNVQVGSNALDPGIREALAGAAAIAVANNIGDPNDKIAFLKEASGNLMAADGLVQLRGQIGLSQARIDQAEAQSQAAAAAMKIERNDRVSADPFETATRLQKVQTQLETHFTMIGRMSKLSLVNYI